MHAVLVEIERGCGACVCPFGLRSLSGEGGENRASRRLDPSSQRRAADVAAVLGALGVFVWGTGSGRIDGGPTVDSTQLTQTHPDQTATANSNIMRRLAPTAARRAAAASTTAAAAAAPVQRRGPLCLQRQVQQQQRLLLARNGAARAFASSSEGGAGGGKRTEAEPQVSYQ